MFIGSLWRMQTRVQLLCLTFWGTAGLITPNFCQWHHQRSNWERKTQTGSNPEVRIRVKWKSSLMHEYLATYMATERIKLLLYCHVFIMASSMQCKLWIVSALNNYDSVCTLTFNAWCKRFRGRFISKTEQILDWFRVFGDNGWLWNKYTHGCSIMCQFSFHDEMEDKSKFQRMKSSLVTQPLHFPYKTKIDPHELCVSLSSIFH